MRGSGPTPLRQRQSRPDRAPATGFCVIRVHSCVISTTEVHFNNFNAIMNMIILGPQVRSRKAPEYAHPSSYRFLQPPRRFLVALIGDDPSPIWRPNGRSAATSRRCPRRISRWRRWAPLRSCHPRAGRPAGDGAFGCADRRDRGRRRHSHHRADVQFRRPLGPEGLDRPGRPHRPHLPLRRRKLRRAAAGQARLRRHRLWRGRIRGRLQAGRFRRPLSQLRAELHRYHRRDGDPGRRHQHGPGDTEAEARARIAAVPARLAA